MDNYLLLIQKQGIFIRFKEFFNLKMNYRMGLLERMPLLEIAVVEESKKGAGISVGDMSPVKTEPDSQTSSTQQQQIPFNSTVGPSVSPLPVAKETANDLLDLVFGDSKTLASVEPLAPSKDLLADLGLASPKDPFTTKDPLGDLLSLNSLGTNVSNQLDSSASVSTSLPPLVPLSVGNSMSLTPTLSYTINTIPSLMIPSAIPTVQPILSTFTPSTMASQPSLENESKTQKYICFDKKGLLIHLKPSKESDTLIKLTAFFEATSSYEVTSIALQVAVPKVFNFI